MLKISTATFALATAALVATATVAEAGANSASGAASETAATSSTAQQSGNDTSRITFEINCSGCHDISEATSVRKDPPGWAATVQKMVDYGAPISEPDQKKIIDYLSANYSASTH